MAKARHEADCHCEQCDDNEQRWGGKTADEIMELAQEAVAGVLEQADTPLVHKLMVLAIIDNFIDWHSRVAVSMAEDGNTRSSVGWARDAGKFQAIANILQTISLDEEDFTMA